MSEHTTRLKKKIRGFYHDPAPGFVRLKDTFDAAAKGSNNAKLAGVLNTLQKFGLLNAINPVEILANLFKETPTKETSGYLGSSMKSIFPEEKKTDWTNEYPMQSSGSTLDQTSSDTSSSGMEYHGV
jgi:hypothetical protein